MNNLYITSNISRKRFTGRKLLGDSCLHNASFIIKIMGVEYDHQA